MQKHFIPRLIPALMAVAFSGVASAAGFHLQGEQNAAGIGNAGAGSAAVAENAATIYYNPAGMTELKSREVSLGLTAVKTSFKFNDQGSIAPGLTGEGGDGGGWGVVPNAYMSWAVSKDIYVGLGIGAPFGLVTEYDKSWLGAAQSISFDIKTININPSIAWRANEMFSIGAGINYQMIDAEYVRRVGTNGIPDVPAGWAPGTTARMTLDDTAWGWNVGALIKPTASTRIGISYRSTVKYHTTGDVKFTGPLATAGLAVNSGAKADVELPDTFIISLVQSINDRVELLADYSWTGWGSIPSLPIYRASGAPLQTLDTNFKDTQRVAVGANYKVSDAVKLRFGLAYDETPVRTSAHRLTSLPDNDRTWISAGMQWKPSANSALDLGVAYLYVPDSKINNNQLATGGGWVKGTYEDSAWLIGAQYSLSF